MMHTDIEAWRARMGWTRQEAADALGIAPNSYTAYSLGRQPVPLTVQLACEALEARLEQEATAARAEAATAQAAVASVPQQVAAQVAAVVETLGVTEAALPAVQADPPKGDFSHLTGRDRAAAAFNAQFSS
jgi:transcriptional regulator with XRE-family HTH domain